MLTTAELRVYADEGFVVCPALVPRAACEAACRRVSEIVVEVAAEHASGARREAGFWELMARSRAGIEVFRDPSAGSAAVANEASVMRVGHALHAADAELGGFCAAPAIRDRLRQLVPPPGVVIQSAVVYKQARSDLVQFGPHQDASYLTTEPESLALAFVALDDMDLENGCLEVVPGSHRHGLGVRLRMGPQGFVPVTMGETPKPPARPVDRGTLGPPRELGVPLAVERGSVIFVHGRAYHASGPNRSSGPRRALIVHAMSARSRLLANSWILDSGEPPPLTPL